MKGDDLATMNPLVIFGAGGQGRCVADAAFRAQDKPFAFLDDYPPCATVMGIPVIKSSELRLEDFRFVVAIGECQTRSRKFEWLLAMGGRPAIVVHPTASVSSYASIGEGTVILAGAKVDPGVVIGRNCIINVGAVLGHDTIVENCAHVSAQAVVAARCRIGIGAFVGLGAIVNTDVTVGEFARIGLGAMISHNVPARHKAISPRRKEAMVVPIDA